MSTRDYNKHYVSNTSPTRAQVGDEYYDPISNKLYKSLAVNGTTVTWNEILRTSNGSTSFTGTAYSPAQILTDGATISWDTNLGQVATVTLAGNRTFAAPTNLVNGGFYSLAVHQSSGSNTISWNSVFKWSAGIAPTLSALAGSKDFFTFRSDGVFMYEQGRSLGNA